VFNLMSWLNFATNPPEYIWIEAILLKETPKAILIMFDGKEVWLPRTWVLHLKRNCGERSDSISIKISTYHWTKRAQ